MTIYHVFTRQWVNYQDSQDGSPARQWVNYQDSQDGSPARFEGPFLRISYCYVHSRSTNMVQRTISEDIVKLCPFSFHEHGNVCMVALVLTRQWVNYHDSQDGSLARQWVNYQVSQDGSLARFEGPFLRIS
ncbi:unnamed protein product [Allacma fusca]|uniref:Uncharacterized protein n=1 Tax=Allacma fusca TaxID=39272 RepID=A0A8J2JPP0_9HEXA|nr:unnamed protein product [Allacma fusca]